MRLVTISTARERVGAACLKSGRQLCNVPSVHKTRTGPAPALHNVASMLDECEPGDVVMWLDGDDWLLPGAHAIIEQVYARHPETLVTWGSFVTAAGERGIAAAYSLDEWASGIRRAPWKASHLKTFRAEIARHLFLEHGRELRDGDGGWLTLAIDQAVMFPLLELAGADRSRFNPAPVYVYDHGASFEANATEHERQRERVVSALIRARKPLVRWSSAPLEAS